MFFRLSGEPGLKGEKGQAYESSFILEQTENDLRQLEGEKHFVFCIEY